MKILIVDDVSIVRRILCSLIDEIGGHECVPAENGAVALELLKTDLFDFVISDITMPRMDGWQLLTAIRSDLRLKNLPVLIITGNLTEQDQKRLKKSGADGFLLKPFTMEALQEKMREIVEASSGSLV